MTPRQQRHPLFLVVILLTCISILLSFVGVIHLHFDSTNVSTNGTSSVLHQGLSTFTATTSRRSSNNNSDDNSKIVPSAIKRQTKQVAHYEADGTFNGVPITFKENNGNATSNTYSSVHCVGETFQNTSWIHRSCQFQHLCLDPRDKEFVLFLSPQDVEVQGALSRVKTAHLSFGMNNQSVAIGGLNTKWTWKHGIPRIEWFPRIEEKLPSSYYEMDATWIPFHSLAGYNPGHLVWDDFLPIYTLLHMFSLLDENRLLMRYVLPGDGMWATCDASLLKQEQCKTMFDKFLPLMGVSQSDNDHSVKFTTNRDPVLRETVPDRSNYVCAKQAVAGIGMLTDHGTKLHGWETSDYKYMHNHGRGGVFWEFRQFMIRNLYHLQEGSPPPAQQVQGPPYKITFSIKSSQSLMRGMSFARQIGMVKSAFASDRQVQVQSIEVKNMTVEEQVRVAAESSIFVSVCGGGAVTATFLPRGASLLMYYDPVGGAQNNRHTQTPAWLDWDMFNNAAYLRTHWLPTRTMNGRDDLQLLIQLIRHELTLIQQQTQSKM